MYNSGYEPAVSPAYEAGVYVGFLLLYLYFAFCLYKMARNCGEKESAWWAFVPVVQGFLMLKIANRPLWWFLLMLIPFVNIITYVVVWIDIARNCGKSALWGILAILPILSLFAWGALAVSKPKTSFFTPPTQASQPRTPQNVG